MEALLNEEGGGGDGGQDGRAGVDVVHHVGRGEQGRRGVVRVRVSAGP